MSLSQAPPGILQMSYPKRVREFIPWSKAMVAGATVGNPEYKARRRRRRKRRRMRRKNGSQD